MAFTNLTKLTTMNPLSLNTSGLNDSSTIVNTVQDNVKSNIGNFCFIVSILGLFLFLIWLFYKQDGKFLSDISRAFGQSSIFCFFISAGFLLSGWINTILPILWFASTTFLSFIAVYKLKTKGL